MSLPFASSLQPGWSRAFYKAIIFIEDKIIECDILSCAKSERFTSSNPQVTKVMKKWE